MIQAVPATPATFIKPPIAQSTPAPAQLLGNAPSFSETVSNDSTVNIFSKTKTLESTVTHSRTPSHEIVTKQATKPPRQAAIVTKAISSNPQSAPRSMATGGKLTKRDLIDLGKFICLFI